MVLGGTLALVVRAGVFPHYSANRDEPVYVLQAKALLEGRLWLPVYRHLHFFQPWLTGVRGGKLLIEFPPGWPLVLAGSQAATRSMVPALIVVGALVPLAAATLAREVSGRRSVARVAAALALGAPMVIIHSGIFVSYLITLTLGCFAATALVRGSRRGSVRALLAGGALLGGIFLTRPFDALLWGIPFASLVVVVGGDPVAEPPNDTGVVPLGEGLGRVVVGVRCGGGAVPGPPECGDDDVVRADLDAGRRHARAGRQRLRRPLRPGTDRWIRPSGRRGRARRTGSRARPSPGGRPWPCSPTPLRTSGPDRNPTHPGGSLHLAHGGAGPLAR